VEVRGRTASSPGEDRGGASLGGRCPLFAGAEGETSRAPGEAFGAAAGLGGVGLEAGGGPETGDALETGGGPETAETGDGAVRVGVGFADGALLAKDFPRSRSRSTTPCG